MEDWKKSIILGCVFLAIAFYFIVSKGGISIWSGLLIILSVIDIIHGLRLKK